MALDKLQMPLPIERTQFTPAQDLWLSLDQSYKREYIFQYGKNTCAMLMCLIHSLQIFFSMSYAENLLNSFPNDKFYTIYTCTKSLAFT